MKIFITGAAGYLGSAITRALVKAGHEVRGLTHSKEKTHVLSEMGAKLVLGDMKKPETYRKDAQDADALIHAAFEYGAAGAEADKTALEALIAAARGGKQLVYTSGVWVLGPRRAAPAEEADPVNPLPIVAWRPAHENETLAAGGVVVRPGCVYGEKRGLYATMIQSAEEKHEIQLVGDGTNRWATIYLDDLGELYRLIVEKGPRKTIYHATDGGSEPLKDVAEALLDAAGGGSVECLPVAQARKTFGLFADALALDQSVSSAKARRDLGWKPSVTSVVKNAFCLLEQWKEKPCRLSVA